MHPTIEEIARWRVGDPVRVDVQRRWQQELIALDGELTRLRDQVSEMTKAKAAQAPAQKAGASK